MLFRKKSVILLAFLLLLLPLNVYADYVAKLQVSVEKSLYGPNEEMHVSGSLLLGNISANDTSFLPEFNASINFTLENASGLQAQNEFNTTSSGSFRARSELFTSGIEVNAPPAEGYYNFTATYHDPDNTEWESGGVIRVFSENLDLISINPEKARYTPSENVSVRLKALRDAGGRKVALANITINGSIRYNNRTTILNFACKTASEGECTISATAPATVGTYLLEANNFLSTSFFRVVPFEAFVYVKDSTGQSFKEIFKTNEVATIEVRVTQNGTIPTGEFVFNGTITDFNSKVITNITSTNLNSNNSYTNRFSFTISNQYSNAVYFADITAYKTGGGSASASTSFQIRSWTLTVTKATQNSGFEYEYTTFKNRNISFEIFPKERQNGTVITGLNSTQFNITLKSKTGIALATGNASWNASCSSSGCYTFYLKAPSAGGSYPISVSLNYSSDLQTIHRLISVTTTTLSSIPTNSEGELKELFGTTEFVYLSLTAKNETSGVNVTDVVIESVIYGNGTKYGFTEVTNWSDVNSTNSVLEWAFNLSAKRLKLDAPKIGGNYLINVFINNRTTSASTKFSINPYTVCAAAKSTAGSVDSSSSWYVWQYKTTDTVYLELKISQAKNGLGRAEKTGNGTFSSNYYGMGNACSVDTTKTQVITNATIAVERVVNLKTGATATINTSATFCQADDNEGTYTCAIKPEDKWDSGRYMVNVKITGSDHETTDTAEGVFEAKAFYIWAWSDSWTNKPDNNITFNIQMYEAGTNWWSNYGASGGINGDISIESVEYNGKDGEWIWPPIDIGYNTTGLNSSNVSSGRGTVSLTINRLPKKSWEPGYYILRIKGTDDATGESDYGEAWFGIKRWDAYSTPVEQSGTSFWYKNSFGIKENISLYIRITNAGDWNDNGGTSLGGDVTIGIKKLQYYTSWPPTDLNNSAYAVEKITVSSSSPWYSNANANTYANYVMNISPASGKWDSGYYNVILDVNGTETGYGWFNAIAFNVNTQPTDSGGTYTYTNKGTGPAYFNVSTTKNQKSTYSYYSETDYINTTLKDLVLRTWLEDTWESVEYKYPRDLNVSPLQVNGTTLVTVNKSGNWPSGYYWGEITLQDKENSTGTGYMWFSVRPFRVETSVSQYTIDTDSNVSVNLNIREPDWSNNSLLAGNYTITEIFEDVWSSTGRSKTTYSKYYPNSSQIFNTATILNITPQTSWSTNNNGYHYLTVVVKDNNDGSTQRGWVSFRSVPFAISIGSVSNQYSIPQSNNVTVPITITKAVSGASATANISRVFEWTWPTQTEYAFGVGDCTSSRACQVTGTQNVNLVPPSGGWETGWHYLYLEFISADGSNKLQSDSSVWFKAVNPYEGYFSNSNASGFWQYYFGFEENLTITLYVHDGNYNSQTVNITKIEVSEDGDNCWSESCKSYVNYSYKVTNSNSNQITGTGDITIIKNSAWKRGQHSIKATVQGSAGTAVIKTGYVWVKDTSVPNLTIVSPSNGQAINTESLLFNATTNEKTKCYINIANYDTFSNWYCGGGANVSSGAACNNTRFNGSSYYYQFVDYPPYGPMHTDDKIHYYNISTSGWVNQDYGINAWCYDIDWNYVQGLVTFTINLTPSAIPVKVNLSSPVNLSVVNASSSVTFKYNVTGPANAAVNCSVYVNVSNIWSANTTQSLTLGSSNASSTTNSSTISGFNNGTYKWNAYCVQTTNTTNAAWAGINWTFTVNFTNATSQSNINVTLTSPTNGSTVTTSTVNYNFSFTNAGSANCSLYTNTTGNWQLNQTKNSIQLGDSKSFNNTNIANGKYMWNVHCINATNSLATAWANNWTFLVYNTTTPLAPISINLSSPANGSIINTSMIPIYNVTGPLSLNCSVWGNFTGDWAANLTNNSVSPGTISAGSIAVSTGAYVWNTRCVNATDSTSFAWAGSNWTFTRS